MPTTSPSRGQVACQGGQGHHWDPMATPPGFTSMWWLTVHFRCTSCQTIKRIGIDHLGRTRSVTYIRSHDWVKYAYNEGPSSSRRRLDYISTLSDAFVARKNGRKK